MADLDNDLARTGAQETSDPESIIIDVHEDSVGIDDPSNFQQPMDPLQDARFHQSQEIYYLRNFHAFLIVQLILHDLLLQITFDKGTAVPYRRFYRVVYVVAAINRVFLWNLLIFSSGFSISTLIVAFRKPSPTEDRRIFASAKTILHSLITLMSFMGAQLLIFSLMSLWQEAMGGLEHQEFLPLWGPSEFVRGLSAVEVLYFFVHWSALVKDLSVFPTTRPRLYLWLCYIPFLLLLISIVFSLAHIQLHFPIQWFIYLPYHNLPAANSSLFFILAYLTGVIFTRVRQHFIISSASAYTILCLSLILAYISLGFSQSLITTSPYILNVSNPFAVSIFFPNDGFSLHSTFFVVSNTFTFLALPVCVTNIFTQSAWATRNWGYWTKNIYFSTYVHVLPILLTIYYLRGLPNFMSSATLGLILLFGSTYIATVLPFRLWSRNAQGAISLPRDSDSEQPNTE